MTDSTPTPESEKLVPTAALQAAWRVFGRGWAPTGTQLGRIAGPLRAAAPLIRADERAALAADGRLLPDYAERQWSVRFSDGTVLATSGFTEAGARQRAAEYTKAGDPAEPVWRRVGPWRPDSPPVPSTPEETP